MRFIGIDVHKQIYTACVLDDNEKVIDELNDIPVSDEGLCEITARYEPNDCVILFENLTRAHFVYHWFSAKGYDVTVAHTGHGSLQLVSGTNMKNDSVDAYKLALIAKDLYNERRFIRVTHITDVGNMKNKSLVRIYEECSKIHSEMNLRIQEYMSMNGLQLPERYKSFDSKRSIKYILGLNDPALNIMVNMMSHAMEQEEYAEGELERLMKGREDVKLLTSIKGISTRTASVIVTVIDGIGRFSSPEKLVSYVGLGIRHSESAGKVKKGHITKEGDSLFRKVVANVIAKHSMFCGGSDLSKYYRRMKMQFPHWKAVTCCMRKLTCIIWAMLTRNEPFRFHPGA